jgi:lipoate-protein ligase B
MDYCRALDIQNQIRSEKILNPDLPDQLLFVEHPPVFTFGKNGGRENLRVSDDFLSKQGVQTVQTDRGGNITYHGPGQAVLYPIIDLNRANIGVADFVYGLERVMLDVCRKFDVKAGRDERNHGLWIGSDKIGSVGLSIKHGISIHGLALNIQPDLTPFSWINPCGLENVSITSVKKELDGSGKNSSQLSMDAVRDNLFACFCKTFNFSIAGEKEHA